MSDKKAGDIKTGAFDPFQLIREKEREHGAAFVVVRQPRDGFILTAVVVVCNSLAIA